MSGILSAFIGRVAGVVTDAYFNLVTLLLPGNGTNGAQNNTFLDSSTNNFSITRNGNTTQGTFSPFSQTGWSNHFSGSTDNLKFASNTAFAIGTGNFTVEFFINVSSWSGNQRFFIIGASGTDGISIGRPNSNDLAVDIANSRIITYAWTPTVGRWYHVALVRSGTGSNQVTLYIDGSSVATGTSSGSVGQNAAFIGGLDWASSYNAQGYISNLRFSNTAQTISVPTSNYTSDANTVILSCQSNRFIDNSSNGFAITVNGTPSVQAFSPFAPTAAYSAATVGGSGYFDGSGDMLETPSITIGTNPYCFECWLYPTATQGSTTGIFTANTNSGLQLSYFGTIGLGIAEKGIAYQLTYSSGNLPIVNQWNHVAFVRSGTGTNQTSIFLNGVRQANGTVSFNYVASQYQLSTTNAGGTVFQGYIAGARLTNGSTPYDATQSTITIPTAPPTTSASNTTLLLNFTNAGITDATAKNDLETVGNAQISTTQSKFGGSSMYFDGTGDYLTSYNGGGLFRLGTVYTVEMWFYTTTVAAGNAGLINFATTVSGNAGFNLYRSSAEIICNDGATGGTGPSSGASSVSANTWTYLAVVCNGTTTKIYLDGVEKGSYTGTTGSANSMTYVTIGAFNDKTSPFSGYIDDLRVTRGVARTITTPTAAFALQ